MSARPPPPSRERPDTIFSQTVLASSDNLIGGCISPTTGSVGSSDKAARSTCEFERSVISCGHLRTDLELENRSRIQGSSTVTGHCGSTCDRYAEESNATERIRWFWGCSMSEQDSRAQQSGRDLIRAEIDVPPTPPDPNRPLPIPKTPPAPPTPTDEPPPEPVEDPPAEFEPKPPYTVEQRTR